MSLPLINNICNITMGNQPLVSVIVPIYNHEKFIEKRIESILNQTFKDCEIIILDDCSTDNSYSIIEKYHSHPSITIIRNEINSACVSRQWQKGVLLAKGKYIWIAEGDDFSDSKFIETLLPAFNKKEVNIAYCASHTIDQNENITPEFYLNIGHYDKLNFPKRRWLQNYTASGTDEIENALSIRNSIPNASAVIMRTDAIKKVDFDLASSFRCTGDWFVYISILKQGEIHYISEHLNYHRIHEDSVISKNKKNIQDIIPDYFQMHKYILQNHPLTKPVFDLMKNSVVRDLKNIWKNCSEQEFSQYYNILHLDMIFNKKK